MTDNLEAEARRVAGMLTVEQSDKLRNAEWRGSGVSSFAVVPCLGAYLSSYLVTMLTLRWDRLTPLGLAVKRVLEAEA